MLFRSPQRLGQTPSATVGNGGLKASDPGAVEEWLALMPPYGGRVSGRTVCPFRRGVASSEAEMFCNLEGRLATLERGGGAGHGRGLRRGALERGGDHPAGSRGVRTGRTAYVGRVLCFFESFTFFQIGRRLQAFVVPIAQHAFGFLWRF